MKLVITGGHLSPLLSLIEHAPESMKISVIGRKHTFEGDNAVSLEYQTLTALHIPFYAISTGRLQRKISILSMISLLKIPVGFVQSLILLSRIRPDVTLVFGGYIAFPVALASYVLRIPIVVHEQTLEAGFANKIIAKFAGKVCISWKQSGKFFPKEKVAYTGIPLRKNILSLSVSPKKSAKPFLYITGGSTGAHGLNVLIEGCVEKLLKKYEVVHQVGDAQNYQDFDRLTVLKDTLPKNVQQHYTIVKFVNPDKVGEYMAQSDLVIARSGINTVSELLYLGQPGFLIPLPHGQRGEQEKNAQFFKEVGLGDYRSQRSLTPETLYQEIERMIEKRSEYQKSVEQVKGLIPPDAAVQILHVIQQAA